jgi:protein-tyrosine phosphatase
MWRRVEHSDILVVCTGNVCRSPYIAARLKSELPRLSVGAAGTGALVGRQPTPPVASLLAARGAVDELPNARSISRRLVRGAALVLTAERGHRVATDRLGASDRAFTLLELARLIREAGCPSGLGVDGVVDLGRRGVAQGDERDHQDDLADPFGLSLDRYAEMAARVELALDAIVPALRRAV